MAAVHVLYTVLATCGFIIITILRVDDLSAAQSIDGFLSVDCGSTRSTNYTDALGLVWTPDVAISADIGRWSSTADVSAPTGDTTGGEKFRTLRYFPQPVPNATTSSTSAAKFCYVLPAVKDAYYLIRASFWYGTSVTTTIYSTRVAGTISFRMIVDTYAGVQIVINLPQRSPLTEEMYVRVQNGSTSISVCFSAADAGGTSDAPFVSALELRPLPATLSSVAMVSKTNTALRRAERSDFGAATNAPPVIRFPSDTLDRLWDTYSGGNVNRTTAAVSVRYTDYAPVSMVQTSYVASSTFWSYRPNVLLDGRLHRYSIALYFAEIDPRVDASGLRVFDITINAKNVYRGFDVYNGYGLYNAVGIYNPNPTDSYSSIVINATATESSKFPPFIAGAEILQLLDDPMTSPTSPIDGPVGRHEPINFY